MSKLNTIFPNWFSGGGIFSAMNDPPWEGSISSLELDIEYFTNQSGEKQPSSLVKKFITDGELSKENISTVATLIQNRFGRNWIKLWETLTLEYNPISNYDMTETESVENTEQRVNDGNNSSNGNTNVSRYAFNSSNSTPYDKTEVNANGEYTDTMESNGTVKRTLSRTGNIGVTTSQQMIEAQRDLWVWDFFKVVFKDVDSVLTIPVFQLDICKQSNEEYNNNNSNNASGGGTDYILPVATASSLGGIKADPKTDNEVVPAKIGDDGKLYVPKGGTDYILPVATTSSLGGIKADPRTDNEVVPAKIGDDGKLYVPAPQPQDGGLYVLPSVFSEMTVNQVVKLDSSIVEDLFNNLDKQIVINNNEVDDGMGLRVHMFIHFDIYGTSTIEDNILGGLIMGGFIPFGAPVYMMYSIEYTQPDGMELGYYCSLQRLYISYKT